jgi:hypothetical protein
MGVTSSARHPGIEVTQPSSTLQIQTEDALCTLRILNPPHAAGGVEWYDLSILPGGALVSESRLRGTIEHRTVREGEIAVASGEANQVVGPNATARYAADVPHALRNNAALAARALSGRRQPHPLIACSWTGHRDPARWDEQRDEAVAWIGAQSLRRRSVGFRPLLRLRSALIRGELAPVVAQQNLNSDIADELRLTAGEAVNTATCHIQ